jgi:hypothetical protein
VINVDVFMLDWNQHRPWGSYDHDEDDEFVREVVAAFDAGRYEYSFSVQADPGMDLNPDGDQAVAAAEYAYTLQGNNGAGRKVRRDRQTMSIGDAVLIDGKAYVAATFGFERVPALDDKLEQRVKQSWERWTDDRPKNEDDDGPEDERTRLGRVYTHPDE